MQILEKAKKHILESMQKDTQIQKKHIIFNCDENEVTGSSCKRFVQL